MGDTEQDRRWSAWLYGGHPLVQALQGAKGSGANDAVRFPALDLQPNSLVGGRLQYEMTPYLAAALEAWRSGSDIPAQAKVGHPSAQELLNISPSLQARYPIGPVTPYVGAGPVWTRTSQWDNTGSSPPSLDFGGQAYAGAEIELTPLLRAMLELKYHRAKLQPADAQGQFNGMMNDLSFIGGLGVKW